MIDHGPDPRGVARVVVAAATRAAPRLHYRVGGQARLAAWGRRLLPDRLFERYMRCELRLPAG